MSYSKDWGMQALHQKRRTIIYSIKEEIQATLILMKCQNCFYCNQIELEMLLSRMTVLVGVGLVLTLRLVTVSLEFSYSAKTIIFILGKSLLFLTTYSAVPS